MDLVAAREWFGERGWRPLGFQEATWEAMARGESGLLHSSTGSGKTLAVWMGAVIASKGRPRVLWITPLRALVADTLRSLEEPGRGLGISFGQWTGDTPPAERRRHARRLPDALVTTPESLALMLSRSELAAQLPGFSTVVVDEWHELMGGKRGALLELCLARLRALRPDLRTWGLSATLGNTGEAARALGGMRPDGAPRPMTLLQGAEPKRIEIETLLPDESVRIPWAGHLGLALLDEVVRRVRASASSIVFTNTRAQAELWHEALSREVPAVGLHHGSLDREDREAVERGLREGSLRAVVATSSLDLGVDFAPVETVFQVGCPKGIARLLQRAGRSGHRPGAVSRVICVPANTFELIEIAAARAAAECGKIEARRPSGAALDVLCQHIVTLAAGGGFRADALFREVRTAHAYRNLDERRWSWALACAGSGGSSLSAYERFRKLERDGDGLRIASEAAARAHRMGIGVIASDAAMEIRLLGGRRLGEVEEAFAARLKRGQVFRFGGRSLELVRIRGQRAEVRIARRVSGAVPRWMGGKMPLSTELAEAVREMVAAPPGLAPETRRLATLLEIQRRMSAVPGGGELLIEEITTREGIHLVVYPFEGRAANEGLGAVVACRMGAAAPGTFSIAANDYGFELLSPVPHPATSRLRNGEFFAGEHLDRDLLASVNAAELAKRRFREIARVAGLSFPGFPAARKTVRQMQVSAGLLYDVFSRYDPENLLLEQAREEALATSVEADRIHAALARMRSARVIWQKPPGVTPFAYPLIAERLRASLSTEDFETRLKRIESELEYGSHGGRSRRAGAAAAA